METNNQCTAENGAQPGFGVLVEAKLNCINYQRSSARRKAKHFTNSTMSNANKSRNFIEGIQSKCKRA